MPITTIMIIMIKTFDSGVRLTQEGEGKEE